MRLEIIGEVTSFHQSNFSSMDNSKRQMNTPKRLFIKLGNMPSDSTIYSRHKGSGVDRRLWGE